MGVREMLGTLTVASVALGLACWSLPGWPVASAQQAPAQNDPVAGLELVRDRHFRDGFVVWHPKPGKKMVSGRLLPPGGTAEPAWGLAQWSSRFPLENGRVEKLPDGRLRFANEAKAVVFGETGTGEPDLCLRVNGSVEYGTRARRQGEPWPHLLVEQRLRDAPPLSELGAVYFHLEARLTYLRKVETSDYSPGIHAAQFPVFFTVQNLNRHSAGYGDYYWFGIPVFDDRARVPKRAAHGDVGTGKLIFSVPGDRYANGSTHEKEWVTFAGDLLPEMLDGLRVAWERGFLKDSRNLADYHISGMNMGWEMPGIFDAEMETRNLSVRVVRVGDR